MAPSHTGPQLALLGRVARRWMLIPLALSLPAGFATFREQTTESPVFKAITEMAPAWVWGICWLTISVSALITLRYGYVITYRFTNVAMIFMSLMWGGSTVIAKFIDGVPVTSTALGLWGFVSGASLFASFMPYQVAHPAVKSRVRSRHT